MWSNSESEPEPYWFASLPLGLRSSAKLYSDFAEGLNYICKANGAADDTVYYLDDILTLGPSQQACKESLDIILKCSKECGFGIRQEKTVQPCRSIEYLGITIDSQNKVLKVSNEKVEDMQSELQEWLNRKSCTKRQVLSLLGKLTFYAQVVKYGHMFKRRLIEASKSASKLNDRIKMDEEMRKDIKWWYSSIKLFNVISWYPREFDASSAV